MSPLFRTACVKRLTCESATPGEALDERRLRRAFLRDLAFAAAGLLVPSGSRADPTAADLALTRWRSPLLRDHALVGRLWDATAQRYTSLAALVESLVRADLRLLGEVHDNPDHHAIQAQLLEALGATRKPRVAFEQFDSEFDAALQAATAGADATARSVADAVHFDRKGWNWDFYAPLVAIALRHGMPLRAANLSRAAAARIAREGSAAVDPALATVLVDRKPVVSATPAGVARRHP